MRLCVLVFVDVIVMVMVELLQIKNPLNLLIITFCFNYMIFIGMVGVTVVVRLKFYFFVNFI